MGVTIHYQGRLRSPESLETLMQSCRDFASASNDWKFKEVAESKTLMRVVNGQNQDYQGFVRGVIVQPPGLCDPLGFEFDNSFFLQDYCKTQFSGASVHIQVISLLKLIEPFFEELKVIDEGEYWGASNEETLHRLMQECNQWMLETKRGNPDYIGPIVQENGRIADLVRVERSSKDSWLSKLFKK